MRSLLTAPLLALSLAGCVTTGTGTTTGNPQVTQVISEVQSATKLACSFVPTAQTIANIFKTGGFSSVFDVVNAICGAVAAPAGTARRAHPTVHGVIVHGRFIGSGR